jgi:spermidine synthase
LFALALYSAVLPFVFARPVLASTVVFPLLALLAGSLGGMAFPLAAALRRADDGRVAGVLYAADLIGGGIGALLSVVVLVPVFGVQQTCWAMALVGLVGLVVL